MALITRDELNACYELLEDIPLNKAEARLAIVDILEAIAPTKLMDSYDKTQVLTTCKQCGDLTKYYNFGDAEAAIELQFPELWDHRVKMIEALETTKKIAEYLSKPVDVGDL